MIIQPGHTQDLLINQSSRQVDALPSSIMQTVRNDVLDLKQSIWTNSAVR